tara:strand:+ start:723 stop:6503 length:5781 start_codon:yes stop_codon:yes gene_type:complete
MFKFTLQELSTPRAAPTSDIGVDLSNLRVADIEGDGEKRDRDDGGDGGEAGSSGGGKAKAAKKPPDSLELAAAKKVLEAARKPFKKKQDEREEYEFQVGVLSNIMDISDEAQFKAAVQAAALRRKAVEEEKAENVIKQFAEKQKPPVNPIDDATRAAAQKTQSYRAIKKGILWLDAMMKAMPAYLRSLRQRLDDGSDEFERLKKEFEAAQQVVDDIKDKEDAPKKEAAKAEKEKAAAARQKEADAKKEAAEAKKEAAAEEERKAKQAKKEEDAEKAELAKPVDFARSIFNGTYKLLPQPKGTDTTLPRYKMFRDAPDGAFEDWYKENSDWTNQFYRMNREPKAANDKEDFRIKWTQEEVDADMAKAGDDPTKRGLKEESVGKPKPAIPMTRTIPGQPEINADKKKGIKAQEGKPTETITYNYIEYEKYTEEDNPYKGDALWVGADKTKNPYFDWLPLENFVFTVYNRKVALNIKRAELPPEQQFGDGWNAIGYDRLDELYTKEVMAFELVLLTVQRNKAVKNIKDLYRKDGPGVIPFRLRQSERRVAWFNGRLPKSGTQAYKNNGEPLKRFNELSAALVVNASVAKMNAKARRRDARRHTSERDQNRLSAKKTEESAMPTEAEIQRLEGLLEKETDPAARVIIEDRIASMKAKLDALLAEVAKYNSRALEAEAAALAARKAAEGFEEIVQEEERKAAFEAFREKIKDKIVDESAQLAAGALMLEKERVDLKKQFESRNGGNDMRAEKRPEQPRWQRENNYVDSSATSFDGNDDDERAWPIAGEPLSDAQHLELWLSAEDMKEDKPDDDPMAALPGDGEGSDKEDGEEDAQSEVGDYSVPGSSNDGPVAMDESVSIGATANDNVTSDTRIKVEDLQRSQVVVFNTHYARHLLAEHIISLKKMHVRAMRYNPKAAFVNVAESVGKFDEANPDLATNKELQNVVDKLLPIFESMVKYRNTILWVKRLEAAGDAVMAKQLERDVGVQNLAKGEKVRVAGSNIVALDAIIQGSVKRAFKIDARLLIQYEHGRMPGQLYTPQPFILPLRIAAPPRLGKSATALLAGTLAKRLGMVTFYSVSPNKKVPISELQQKLIRIGWRNTWSSTNNDNKARPIVPAAYGGADDAYKQANSKTTAETVGNKERVCVNMHYAAYPIEAVPKGSGTDCDPEVWDMPDPDPKLKQGVKRKKVGSRTLEPTATSLIDMIIYSSDTTEDPMRVGAILSEWRHREHVVFHIRDEAQSLAKEEKNPERPCHRRDVPPPQQLAYLRKYFGNLFGLNMTVTATHFPTLLEENLWGYFGSVGQNRRANMAAAATVATIRNQVGANFLPKLVPALIPYKPKGYIGVEALEAWVPVDIRLRKGWNKEDSVALTDFGAGYTASASKGTGELEDSQLDPEILPDATSASSIAAPSFAMHGDSTKLVQTSSIGVSTRSRSAVSRQRDGADLENRTAKEQKADLDEDQAAGKLDELSVYANLPDAPPPAAPSPPAASGKRKKKDTDADYMSPEEKKAAQLEAKRQQALTDLKNISQHWMEFYAANAKDIDELYEPKRATGDQYVMVPMYIGALNNNIKDTGMVSFMRSFSRDAHAAFKKEGYTSQYLAGNSGSIKRRFGCAFIIFSTTLKTRADLVDTNIKVLESQTGDIPYFPTAPANNATVVYKACEMSSFGGSTPMNKSAVVCVYDPTEPENGEIASGTEPKLYCFFTSAADKAIEHVWEKYKGTISKFSVLGYGMLEAGLTVQTYLPANTPHSEGKQHMFCPLYVALATSDSAPLDAQLQIAGRAFVDLKEREKPPKWRIQLLAIKDRAESLLNYDKMEERFANIGRKVDGDEEQDEEQMPMYEALKRGFGTRIVGLNSLKTLGVLGVRRGEFARILGLTPDAVNELIGAVEKAKVIGTEKQQRAALNNALDAKEAQAQQQSDAAAAAMAAL